MNSKTTNCNEMPDNGFSPEEAKNDNYLSKKYLSFAIANYIHREIIEEAHSCYNISQNDMEAMNRKAVNRARVLVDWLFDETPDKLIIFQSAYMATVYKEWDDPEETEETLEIRKAINELLEEAYKSGMLKS